MKKIAPLFIVFAAILWSLDGILRRELRTIPTATLVMLEHLVGLLILIPFWPHTIKKAKEIEKKDWLVLVFTAVLGGLAGTCFYTLALAEVQYIKYTVVVLLQQTQPIFAIILAHIFLREHLNKQYIWLAILGIAAVYFLSFPEYFPKFIGQKKELFAALFALAAAASWGSATVFSKLILTKVDFLAATTIRFAIVVPCAYLVGILLNQHIPLTDIFTKISVKEWKYLFGIAFTAGAVSICIYYKGLQYTPARTSTILELIYPVSAIFIGYQFLGERLTLIQIIAGATLLFVILKLVFTQIKQENNRNEDKT